MIQHKPPTPVGARDDDLHDLRQFFVWAIAEMHGDRGAMLYLNADEMKRHLATIDAIAAAEGGPGERGEGDSA